jgi:hypothetical protein
MGNPPDVLLRLVDRFDQDRKVFVSADYKEEQLRLEFLNPFFSALGWDMDNKQGLSETFKQVIHEFSVMPADVLGQVYEQFLGKVIRLTAGHQAKVEERSKGPVPTRALDGSSAPRKLSAMPCEPRPALTEVEFMSPELPREKEPFGRDLLMSDFGHLNNYDAGRAIVKIVKRRRQKPLRVFLAHLSSRHNSKTRAIQQVRKILKKADVRLAGLGVADQRRRTRVIDVEC